MKNASKLFVVLLLVMFIGCTTGEDENLGGEEQRPETPDGLGKLEDWTLMLGYNNLYDDRDGPLALFLAEDEEKGTVMQVNWATSNNATMCELYATLPAGYDYGEFDGVILEVKPDVSQAIMFAIRNQPIFQTPNGPPGTAWRLSENTYRYTGEWRIITTPFFSGDVGQPGWGPNADELFVKEWLTNDMNRQKTLSINPHLNTSFTAQPPAVHPKGNARNVLYTNLYKRIGFYKGDYTAYEEDPVNNTIEICWVWKFGDDVDEE